jgi:hypothetical protein
MADQEMFTDVQPVQQAEQKETFNDVQPLSKPATTPTVQGTRPALPKEETKPGLLGTANEYYEKGTGVVPALGRLALTPVNLANSIYHSVVDAPKNPEETATQSSMANPIEGRMALAGKRLLVDPSEEAYKHVDEQARAQEAREGHRTFGQKAAEVVGKGESLIPMVGPYGMQLGERATKDPSGAITEGLGMALAPEAASEAMPGGVLPGAAAEGARPFPTVDAAVRGVSKAAGHVLPAAPYAAGAAVGHPYVGARIYKSLVPEALENTVEKGKVFGLSPEEASHQQLEERATKSAAEAKKTQDVVDRYKASKEQNIEPPEDVVKANEKAQARAAEDRLHADNAKEALEKSKQPAEPDRAIETITPKKEPEVPKPLGKPINVKGPGEVQPETFPQEPLEKPYVPFGRLDLPDEQGVRLGERLRLPEKGTAPKGEVITPEKPAPKPKPLNIPKTIDQAGNLINEGLGNEKLHPNVPLKEQSKAFGRPMRSEVPDTAPEPKAEVKPEEPKVEEKFTEVTPIEETKVPEKLSSDPRKAVLQKAKATPEQIEKILSRGAKYDPTSKVGLSKLAEHFGVDLGDKAIGRGKGDVAAGTHLSPDAVLKKIIDAGHSPEDIAKAVDEGKHLPTVKGGSQEASAPAKELVGTEEGARNDTALFQKAKEELGTGASISDIAKRAQEMKDEAKNKYTGPERRETERKAPMSAVELEDAIKNRKPIVTPFDQTEGAKKTIEKDLESKGLGTPKAEPTAHEHTYEYNKQGNTHTVTARDPEGNSKAIITASSEDKDPKTWTVRLSYSEKAGKGIGERAYMRLAEAARSEANRSGNAITLRGDDSMTPAAKRTWQKLGSNHGYSIRWNDNRPSMVFHPEQEPK